MIELLDSFYCLEIGEKLFLWWDSYLEKFK